MNSTRAPGAELTQSRLTVIPARIEAPGTHWRTARRASIVFLIWTLLGVLSGSQAALYRVYNDQSAEWGRLIGHSLADWYSIAIFSPLILWLVGRWPVKGAQWLRRAALYVLVAALMVVIRALLYTPVRNLFLPHPVSLYYMLVKAGSWDFFVFGAVFGVAHAVQYARSLRERELRASQLEARLSRAQLEVLRSELQPHFLFNTLHAIS